MVQTVIHTAMKNVLNKRFFRLDNPKIKAMIMYSGGADSLALAKGLLESTTHQILIHHVIVKNNEKRDNFELKMLEEQMKFLRNNCRKFEFIESTFEMQIGNKAGGLDLSLSLFMGARACVALNNKISLIHTGHLLRTAPTDMYEGIAVMNSVFTNKRFKPIWICPLRGLNRASAKKEIYKSIGKKGLELTVSCREPKFNNGKFESCLSCHACKTRATTIKELGWSQSLVK